MNLPDSYIVEKLTSHLGRDKARAIARWVAEEDLTDWDKDILIERILRHEPLQYIFGHTDWRGMRLDVTPATLIPRPETAELVDWLRSAQSQENDRPLRVLDIGTGSGCIAIALKHDHPEWDVWACDISEDALFVAKQNAKGNKADIHFFRSDILSNHPLHAMQAEAGELSIDILVSNPPYICEEEKAEMENNVIDYEPHSALFVPNNDPLLFYRRIAELDAGQTLLAFEINERFGDMTVNMLRSMGYTDVQLKQDICGKDRIVLARR